MGSWRKFVLRPALVARRFKPFAKTVKSVRHLSAMVSKNKALRLAMAGVFNKTTVKLAAGATAIGVGVSYINNYIQSNSGCFLKTDEAVCKVQALSCCQPDAVDKLPFCPLQVAQPDPCLGYDEDQVASCCQWCDCQYQTCLPNQTMECRRPTIGEALAHYADTWTSSLWLALSNLFPWLVWVLSAGAALLAAWIGITFYKRLKAR